MTRFALLALLATALVGCAVEGDGQFSPIARSEIPFGLPDAATTTAPTTTTTTMVSSEDEDNMVMEEVVDLYYLLGAGLFRVQTSVVSPATPDQVLTLLSTNSLSGPSYVGLRAPCPRNSLPRSACPEESPKSMLEDRSCVRLRRATNGSPSPRSWPRSPHGQGLGKWSSLSMVLP